MRAAAREYPETRLRVGPMDRGDGMRVPMAVGPWMTAPGGEQTVAALGVIIDDAIGIEVHNQRPAGTHSVTTELSVDVVFPPPWPGPELVATSRLAGAGPADGVSRGEVRDGDGRVVAIASGRSRFVPATGIHAGVAEVEREPPERIEPADHRTILQVLDIADLGRSLILGFGGDADPGLRRPPSVGGPSAEAFVPAPRPTADDWPAQVAAAVAHNGKAAGAVLAGGPAPSATPAPPTTAQLIVPPLEAFGNGSGTMHGGLLFAGTDLAAAGLAGALGPRAAADYTTSLRINLLRPALLSEPVIFTASVVNRGRSVSVYRVVSHGSAGRPYTVATVTRSSRP
ncbi:MULTISPECIES: PaaI family thioesterase [unclassified Pseudofrankia]|uniref:PaaI family thioesterase n=1 Tax=unclassified Pseudofrankia TaxID=2994372 RepID=UPI0009F57B65|nr:MULTISPECIES: PaaI family thioesterase [unclassified Pseudofrankia]MDT3445915.1 PaaI family thioesterase [Pseudofrankia sp. BMG5.37]